MKRLVAFDLDGTLAPSKQPIDADRAAIMARLLAVAMVAVISGGDWPQFETQVVARMTSEADLSRLFIMPTTGTKLYRYEAGSWQRIYADLFSHEESKRIHEALPKAIKQAGVAPEKTWGEQIEDRGSQITFSGLGQQAPLDAKDKWDPDRKKREKKIYTLRHEGDDIRAFAARRKPECVRPDARYKFRSVCRKGFGRRRDWDVVEGSFVEARECFRVRVVAND